MVGLQRLAHCFFQKTFFAAPKRFGELGWLGAPKNLFCCLKQVLGLLSMMLVGSLLEHDWVRRSVDPCSLAGRMDGGLELVGLVAVGLLVIGALKFG
jgi:hypothetical protein